MDLYYKLIVLILFLRLNRYHDINIFKTLTDYIIN